MKFKQHTLTLLGEIVVGNPGKGEDPEHYFFRYRSSSVITDFFHEIETEYTHDGSTRHRWAAEVLDKILQEPQAGEHVPPDTFARLIRKLMDPDDAINEGRDRPKALARLNAALARENFEAFYAQDGQCYLRHIPTNTIAMPAPNPHRPFSPAEIARRDQLIAYLDGASEDQLIEEILLPLFRQLGFHRITAAGHKDKALEYGKDVWMRYT